MKRKMQPKTHAPAGEQTRSLEEVVADYRAQAQAADALRGIDATNLADPHTNPHVLTEAVAARDEADREVIRLEAQRRVSQARAAHRRGLQDIEAADRWARALASREDREIGAAVAEADAARADVEAITEAQAATRPATAATRLARSQSRIAGAYLIGGGAGSVMSAIGISAAVAGGTPAGWWAAAAVAAIVEVPTTVLASGVIWSQGHLARNTRATAASTAPDDRAQVRGPAWARRLPWASVAALLTVSVAINAWGVLGGASTGVLGVMGMVGAAVAALAALLGWAYSVQSAAVIAANMADGSVGADLQERRRVASGAHIPLGSARDGRAAAPADTAAQEAASVVPDDPDWRRRQVAQRSARVDQALSDPDVTDALFSAIARNLDDPEDGGDGNGGGGGLGAPTPTGPQGGSGAAAPEGGGASGASPADLRVPQGASPGASGGASRAPERPSTTDEGHARLLEYLAGAGAGASVRGAARALGVDPRTVRRYRDQLAAAGHDMGALFTQPAHR